MAFRGNVLKIPWRMRGTESVCPVHAGSSLPCRVVRRAGGRAPGVPHRRRGHPHAGLLPPRWRHRDVTVEGEADQGSPSPPLPLNDHLYCLRIWLLYVSDGGLEINGRVGFIDMLIIRSVGWQIKDVVHFRKSHFQLLSSNDQYEMHLVES
ncbi:hypothetical protein EJB05_00497, partial [Eragrostis curvula]